MNAFTRATAALSARGCTGRGSSWQCPAHDDRAPSLSVNPNTTGDGVVLHCHAGCDTDDVVTALGLRLGDLYDEPLKARTDRPRVVAEYQYADENGELRYVVRRFEPGYHGDKKTFRQYSADGKPSVKGIPKVLYRLPAVLAEAAAGGTVFVVEGEKDADRLASLGCVATTNVGGAGKWHHDYSHAFVGAGEVVVIADRDKPGRKHAKQVSASLRRAGIPVRVVEPAAGKDVSDHLDYDLDFDALVPVADDDQDDRDEPPPDDPEPPDDDEPRDEIGDQADALIAELLDTDDLDKIPSLEPLVADMLFLDSLARINGPSGHGKSFVSLDFAGCVGTGLDWHGRKVRQGLVLYMAAEGVRGIGRRVRAWEQKHDRKMTGVKVLPRPVQAMEAEWPTFVEACRRLEPVLIVVDTQARVTVGVEENSATEMGKVVHRMEQLRTASGACVLLIHHKGLNGDHGRGSTAVKGAMQTELTVTKAGAGPDTKVTVGTDKQKDSEEIGKLVFRLKQVPLNGEAEEDGRPVTSAVLELDDGPGADAEQIRLTPSAKKLLAALRTLDKPTQRREVIDRVAKLTGNGLTPTEASRQLNTMHGHGLVDRIDALDQNDKTIVWSITEKGRTHSA